METFAKNAFTGQLVCDGPFFGAAMATFTRWTNLFGGGTLQDGTGTFGTGESFVAEETSERT